MAVLVDTGPLVAYLDKTDRDHERAMAILDPPFAGRMGMVLSTDCVFDEGMTLIRARKQSRPLLERFHALFWGPWPASRPFEVVSTTPDDYRAAGCFQIQHFDQGLSLTDCTLILHAQARGALVATFDGRFEGLVGTVPEPGPAEA